MGSPPVAVCSSVLFIASLSLGPLAADTPAAAATTAAVGTIEPGGLLFERLMGVRGLSLLLGVVTDEPVAFPAAPVLAVAVE